MGCLQSILSISRARPRNAAAQAEAKQMYPRFTESLRGNSSARGDAERASPLEVRASRTRRRVVSRPLHTLQRTSAKGTFCAIGFAKNNCNDKQAVLADHAHDPVFRRPGKALRELEKTCRRCNAELCRDADDSTRGRSWMSQGRRYLFKFAPLCLTPLLPNRTRT